MDFFLPKLLLNEIFGNFFNKTLLFFFENLKKMSLDNIIPRNLNPPRKIPSHIYFSNYDYNIVFEFCSKTKHEKQEKTLQKRFEKAKTIKETRLYHSFEPIDCKSIECRETSDSEIFVLHELL